MPPEIMPPDPKPAMALTRMKAIELRAAPKRADLVSNSNMDIRKMGLTLKILNSFPDTRWKAQLVRRYAVLYHPISPAEFDSLVM